MFSGEDERSRFGQLAFVDWDPTRPNEKFFEHLDWVVRRAGDSGRHLITFHPAPRDHIDKFSSADWLADEEWVDFNMLQTGTRIDAHQVRKAMYNAMLSGAAGHTYGCRCVWNFYHEGGPKTRDTDLDWRKALDLGVGRSGLRRADALPDRGARRRRLRLGG